MLKSGMKPSDFKTSLQELTQSKKMKLQYTVEKYPTAGGQENFRASVFLDGNFIAYGNGSTKREAEQNAARLALTKVESSTAR